MVEGATVVVAGEGVVLWVHPATIMAARMKTQPIAAMTKDVFMLVTW
jgi:hypothetical protein